MDTVILIGNTNTKIAYLTKHAIKTSISIRTRDLENWVKKNPFRNKGAIYIASVVPEITSRIRKLISDVKQITWRDFPKEIKVKKPQKVGIDRLLNAAGAWSLVKSECLIIDAGSAITIDVVDRNGNFEGGAIFPGENLIIESLRNLALLRNIKVSRHTSIIGKDTSQAIGSGIVFGLTFLVRGYIEHLKKKNPDLKILFTGGTGKVLQKRIKSGTYEKDLAVIGIKEILYGNL